MLRRPKLFPLKHHPPIQSPSAAKGNPSAQPDDLTIQRLDDFTPHLSYNAMRPTERPPMKLATILLAALLLAACESTTTTTKSSESQRGAPLGNSNVHVSGSIQTGGAGALR
jgi:hypothetical protein